MGTEGIGLLKWIASLVDSPVEQLHIGDLSTAVYTMNESASWSAFVELDTQTVLQAWALVEALKMRSLPEEYKL